MIIAAKEIGWWQLCYSIMVELVCLFENTNGNNMPESYSYVGPLNLRTNSFQQQPASTSNDYRKCSPQALSAHIHIQNSRDLLRM